MLENLCFVFTEGRGYASSTTCGKKRVLPHIPCIISCNAGGFRKHALKLDNKHLPLKRYLVKNVRSPIAKHKNKCKIVVGGILIYNSTCVRLTSTRKLP